MEIKKIYEILDNLRDLAPAKAQAEQEIYRLQRNVEDAEALAIIDLYSQDDSSPEWKAEMSNKRKAAANEAKRVAAAAFVRALDEKRLKLIDLDTQIWLSWKQLSAMQSIVNYRASLAYHGDLYGEQNE